MKVNFGVWYKSYADICLELPDEYKNSSNEEIEDYIRSHWDNVPIPKGEYVPGSEDPDFDNFYIEE